MNAEEIRADQEGANVPCDERHYTRFLRKVLPGPEKTRGDYCCDACGQYFDQQGRPLPPPK